MLDLDVFQISIYCKSWWEGAAAGDGVKARGRSGGMEEGIGRSNITTGEDVFPAVR